MYLTAGAAILALDFCIQKTLRVLRNLHALYSKAYQTLSPPLKRLLEPLHVEFKIGMALCLLEEYEHQPPQEKELALRHVLKHLHSTCELIECEAQRLQKQYTQYERRWITIMGSPDWRTECKRIQHWISHLDQQIQMLLLLRRCGSSTPPVLMTSTLGDLEGQ